MKNLTLSLSLFLRAVFTRETRLFVAATPCGLGFFGVKFHLKDRATIDTRDSSDFSLVQGEFIAVKGRINTSAQN